MKSLERFLCASINNTKLSAVVPHKQNYVSDIIALAPTHHQHGTWDIDLLSVKQKVLFLVNMGFIKLKSL